LKKSILHIISFLLLFSFIGLLVVSTTSILNLDEENEESIELGLEDFFDEDVVIETHSFFFNCSLGQILRVDLNTILPISTVYLVGKYSIIERSIPVPPPELKA